MVSDAENFLSLETAQVPIGKWMDQKTMAQLLVGMQTGEATVENSMEFPQNTKNGTAFWPSNSTVGIIP